jgi:hypothetical protein
MVLPFIYAVTGEVNVAARIVAVSGSLDLILIKTVFIFACQEVKGKAIPVTTHGDL